MKKLFLFLIGCCFPIFNLQAKEYKSADIQPCQQDEKRFCDSVLRDPGLHHSFGHCADPVPGSVKEADAKGHHRRYDHRGGSDRRERSAFHAPEHLDHGIGRQFGRR